MRVVPSLLRRGGGPRVSLEWLHDGLLVLAWATRRPLPASLHLMAARTLGEVSSSADPSEEQCRHLAGSFVQFLFERQGMERLRRFFRRAEKHGLEAAALAVFGKGFFALQWEWEELLRSLDV